MSLDKNLFTLLFTPHKDNQNVIDLVDPSGTLHYRKQRVAGAAEYKIEVYDPMSESLLATASAPSAGSKVKIIELCNPTMLVELKYTGTLSFRWSFKWEDHEFEWKREECYMIRKPDPPVIIAVTKEPAGRLRTTSVQILDYNLNRFDIDDRKGLEIVVLTALLTFQDSNDAAHTPEPSTSSSSNPLGRAASVFGSTAASPSSEAAPAPPPKPAPRTGVDRIAELQAIKGEYNEIIVSDEGSVQDYASYCNRMLQDDAMLFISVKSAEAEQVPKVLQVVEETKRIRYKAGLDEEEELHQYVLYDQQEAKKGPRIINLDDDKKNKYAPPKNLTVHLSKISMPELQPKAQGNDKSSKRDSRKDDKKAKNSKPPRPAPNAPDTVPAAASPKPSLPKPSSSVRPSSSSKPSSSRPNVPPSALSSSRPNAVPSGPPASSNSNQKPNKPSKLHRPGSAQSPSPKPYHVPSHQVHPNQPSPSPSQLNNPGIYAAPPPAPPISMYSPRPSSAGPTVPSFPQPHVPNFGGPAQPSSAANLYSSSMPGQYNPQPQPFPPTNWPSAQGPPPPPPPVQQPMNSSSPFGGKPSTTANVVQGASSVVHGLMGLLNSHRK